MGNNFNLKMRLNEYKNDVINSKKYWIIYLILISIAFFSLLDVENYAHPKMEILIFILSAILGVFCIGFYQGHRDDKNFYKTAFIIIFIIGIVFSFLTPIMCNNDEVEHFVRAEMTSNGVVFPEYDKNASYSIDGITYNGKYLTIQSTLDLAEKGKVKSSYDFMDMVNSSVFNTEADTQPINTTQVPFFSAFAQNPFYGYIAPAIGMAIAKLLDLNAIWLLWLGRIFNALLYALLVSYAIKKTPILKMPLFVVSCIPAALSCVASTSINPLINGLAILSIAYFLVLYKSPKKSLDYKPIIKFSLLILLLGLCKVTYFSFIFLILFVPIDNFKEKKYYYYGFISIIILLAIMVLWSIFYIDPGVHHSSRSYYYTAYNVDTFKQIKYILSHKKDALIHVFHLVGTLDNNLKCQDYFDTKFSSLYLMFLCSVFLLFPHEKINLKVKLGALFVFSILYFGTYLLFMVSWNPVGDLNLHGVHSRYFFPAYGLIPIFLGINHNDGDTTVIDNYVLVLTLAFIVFRLFTIAVMVY